ncbi:MAG TPA: NUDIX domain-containing protein [Steroidobacteraceae bacterium]|nr:NUDIX domain-containing protein [Steroidobacteraceae bacterium]HRX89206.1 NUDIX domain-containing protein [Steroidobacteraceae bacterium]
MSGSAARVARAATLSAGVVVVRRAGDSWLCLLLRAFTHWDFPKGLVEAGEDSWVAAVREAAEEAALTDLNFRWGTQCIDTGPYRANKVARYYLAETHTGTITLPVNELIGRPEHHEGRWATLAEARELVSPRLWPVLEWAQKTLDGGANCRS